MKKIIALFSLLILCCSLTVGLSAVPAKAADSKEVLILMYHCIVNNGDKKDTYIITPEQLENDIKYLIDHNYQIVAANDLIAYAEGKISLGDRIAVLTFDDGFYNNYKYAVPLFEKYNVKGVFAVVGSYADDEKLSGNKTSRYAYMDWTDIERAYSSNFVEIASHSYNMHKSTGRIGMKKRKNETNQSYRSLIENDILTNDRKLTEICGKKPTVFAYPFGLYNSISEQVLKENGYLVTLTCNEGKSKIYDLDSLRLLKRYNRDGKLSTQAFMKKVNA